ncbi:MAG: TonB family protein [Gammaproteobacteria bacterium]
MSVPLDTDSSDLASPFARGSDIEVLVLSRDGALISGIGSALEGRHRVHHARRPALAIELLNERNVAVLITDLAESPAFRDLAPRFRQRVPDLSIIGVGDRDAAESLIESINSGQVDSVMLKPLSVGRIRLQVQNAVRQYLQARDAGSAAEAGAMATDPDWDGDRTEPHSGEWLEDALPEVSCATHPQASRASHRRLMIGGSLAGALASAVVLALVLRAQDDPERRDPVAAKATKPNEVALMATGSKEPERQEQSIASLHPIEELGVMTVASGPPDLAAALAAAASEPPAEPGERRAMFERLALANERIESNNLTRPENDSAMFHLLSLQAVHPEDEEVVGAIERFADILLSMTDAAILERDFSAATRWLNKVDELDVRAEASTARRESLAIAEAMAAEAVMKEATALTEAALNAELEQTEAALAEAALAQSPPAQVESESLEQAISEAPVQIASTRPVAIDPQPGAGALLDADPVEVTELKAVQMVAPEYPRRAYVRDIVGWIDVEFTVTETGLTRAIEVTGEQVPGWFGRAAIEAVEQWKFLPELRAGQPVDRRAKVRLQFTRED